LEEEKKRNKKEERIIGLYRVSETALLFYRGGMKNGAKDSNRGSGCIRNYVSFASNLRTIYRRRFV